MNIVIDIRPLMGGKISGIETYIKNLLENLFKQDHKNTYILFANASKNQSKYLPKFEQRNVTTIQTKIPNKLLNLCLFIFKRPKLDQLVLNYLKKHPQLKPITMMGAQIDLFFMPDLRMSSLSKQVKKITVVHDLSFQHFPHFFSLKTRLWYILLQPKNEIAKSTKVIAVSDFTKNDLIKTFKVPSGKITVIQQGINGDFGMDAKQQSTDAILKKYHLEKPYFLSLSTLEPRKNIARLIQAFHLYKKKNTLDKTTLVLAGIQHQKIFSALKLPSHHDIIFPGFIDENDKATVMKAAIAFIYPSLFEGFGLPLLEVMKCGTPIITSHTSAMPEVTGKAALLINPEKVEEIAAALEEIQKPEVKIRLQQEMSEQIKKFSWELCAQKTLEVISSFPNNP